MPVQTFLPVLERRTKQLHGLVAISSTNFNGSETVKAIGGKNYPIVKYEPVVTQYTRFPWYMALDMTYLQVRQRDFTSIPGFIPIEDVSPDQSWTMASATGGVKNNFLGAMIQGLIYGFGANLSVTTVTPPDVDDTNAAYVWLASVPFANQPQCTFFDFNWVEAIALNNNEGSPARLVINSVTDGVGGAQTKVRAVVVTVGQPALNRATYDTIRLVRMPNQLIEAGDAFIVNATVYGQNGFNEAVQIDITVI